MPAAVSEPGPLQARAHGRRASSARAWDRGEAAGGSRTGSARQGCGPGPAQRPAARGAVLRVAGLRGRGRPLHRGRHRAHADAEGAPVSERPKPEIRLDQLTGLRTILAPARADRPFDFGGVPTDDDEEAKEKCPFCEGREDRTPPETWADRPGGGAPDSPRSEERRVGKECR